jgi:hypothetical protein
MSLSRLSGTVVPFTTAKAQFCAHSVTAFHSHHVAHVTSNAAINSVPWWRDIAAKCEDVGESLLDVGI